jgi:hypothetical protein
MKEHLFNWVELDPPAPQAPDWIYQWVEINLRLHAFIRYGMEDTLDKMPKLRVEWLAFVQDINGQGWEWRGLRYADEQLREMAIPSPQHYKRIILQVEEIIRKELDASQE